MITGKHALVTGGGTGVGRAIAMALAETGVAVTICGRRKEQLAAVADANRRISAIAADVTDEVFNVASGTETSLLTLAQTLTRIMGSPLDLQYAPARKVNAVPRRLADVSKARDLLGFEAQMSLEEGLRDLVKWWRRESAATRGEAA